MIQQSSGQQLTVSIHAGVIDMTRFPKVFVSEIVEKGDSAPFSETTIAQGPSGKRPSWRKRGHLLLTIYGRCIGYQQETRRLYVGTWSSVVLFTGMIFLIVDDSICSSKHTTALDHDF